MGKGGLTSEVSEWVKEKEREEKSVNGGKWKQLSERDGEIHAPSFLPSLSQLADKFLTAPLCSSPFKILFPLNLCLKIQFYFFLLKIIFNPTNKITSKI